MNSIYKGWGWEFLFLGIFYSIEIVVLVVYLEKNNNLFKIFGRISIILGNKFLVFLCKDIIGYEYILILFMELLFK